MKKFLTLTTTLTLMMVVLLACTGEPTAENGDNNEESVATTLTVGRGMDSQIMDPQGSNSGADALIWTQIYEGLVRLNNDLEIEGVLAHDWEQIDDLTWRFFLREDIYFHNGDPFTSADVEFTLLRALDSPSVSHIVGEIDPEGIVIVDDYTIEITTTEPFAPFLVNMTLPGMSILNERAIEEAGDDINENPVGTGPFMFEDWDLGERITLVRNDNYHGDLAQVETLIFQVIPEPSNRMIALEVGDVDMVLDLAPSDIHRVEELDELNLIRRSDLATHYLAFNTNFEPLNDVRVRQAINYAIHVEEMIETILEGVGGVATGPMNENVWAHHPNLTGYGFDPIRAQELLADAGLEDGFEVNLTVNGENAMRVNMAAVIQSQLSDIGITVTLRNLENVAYTEYVDSGEGQMYILGWTNVTADPENGLFPLFHSSRHGSAGNRTFFANDHVDELLEAGRAEMDPAQREAYYLEAQEIIVDEAPWAFLTTGEIIVATSEHVTDFVPSPRGLHFFDRVRVNQ